jgi:hypothetical protein
MAAIRSEQTSTFTKINGQRDRRRQPSPLVNTEVLDRADFLSAIRLVRRGAFPGEQRAWLRAAQSLVFDRKGFRVNSVVTPGLLGWIALAQLGVGQIGPVRKSGRQVE